MRRLLLNALMVLMALLGGLVNPCRSDGPKSSAAVQHGRTRTTLASQESNGVSASLVVAVATVPQAQAQSKSPSPPPPDLSAALEQPVTVQFVDVALKDFVRYLRDHVGVNVIVDVNSLEEAGTSLDATLTIEAKAVPLEQVLRYALGQLELDFYVDNQLLVITTTAGASDRLEVRAYPVGDIIASLQRFTLRDLTRRAGVIPGRLAGQEGTLGWPIGGAASRMSSAQLPGRSGTTMSSGGPSAGRVMLTQFAAQGGFGHRVQGHEAVGNVSDAIEQLQELLQQVCSPETWKDAGGLGVIGSYGTTLVVRQTPRVHEQIEATLTQLRDALSAGQQLRITARWYAVSSKDLPRFLTHRSAAAHQLGGAGGIGHQADARTGPSLRPQPGQRHGSLVAPWTDLQSWPRPQPPQQLPQGKSGVPAVLGQGPGGAAKSPTSGQSMMPLQGKGGFENFINITEVPEARPRSFADAARVEVLAVISFNCLPGQTVGVLGGESISIVTDAIPVVAENSAESQLIVREGLAGLRAEFSLYPTGSADQYSLRAFFALTDRIQPERTMDKNPDQYRAPLAATTVQAPITVNKPTVVAVLPLGKEHDRHVVFEVTVEK